MVAQAQDLLLKQQVEVEVVQVALVVMDQTLLVVEVQAVLVHQIL
jgi:hypothetical protein